MRSGNGEKIKLRDGANVALRPIAPDDRERLRSAFAGLSDRSRYLRFQTPMPELSDRQLSYLTDVDHHDHEALLALSPEGQAVGVARFVRVADDVAECAVVVADEWQGRGLGTALLDQLVERAREEDVARFSAVVMAENDEAIRLLERLGDVERRRSGPQMEFDVALPPVDGADDRVRALLRAAASGALVPAVSMWRLVADFAYRRRASPPDEPANAIVVEFDLGDDADGDGRDSGGARHAGEGAGPAADAGEGAGPAADAGEGAAPGGTATRIARGLAAARGAHLHVVSTRRVLAPDRDEAAGRLDAAAERLRAGGLEVTAHLRSGEAADAVIDVAEEQAAALIVIEAGRDAGLMPRRSVADRVCARAPCDVLIAR